MLLAALLWVYITLPILGLFTYAICGWGYNWFKKITRKWKFTIILCIGTIYGYVGWKLYTFNQESNTQEVIRNQEKDTINDISPYERMELFGHPVNTVFAHDERDTIVGNFTGQGIDTIYVVSESPAEFGGEWRYWAVCSNSKIPKVELWGYNDCQPKLVFEGDLDGNGTDEWGYLHTWNASQWRTYRVYTLVGCEWRFLTDDWELLNTNEYFRASRYEVIEPGPKKGFVKINYCTDGFDCEIKDTIVVPTYSKIDE